MSRRYGVSHLGLRFHFLLIILIPEWDVQPTHPCPSQVATPPLSISLPLSYISYRADLRVYYFPILITSPPSNPSSITPSPQITTRTFYYQEARISSCVNPLTLLRTCKPHHIRAVMYELAMYMYSKKISIRGACKCNPSNLLPDMSTKVLRTR